MTRQLFSAVIAALFGICSVSGAATIVDSTIQESTTWTVDGSPYEVQTEILVAYGAVLTIEPGVEVIVSVEDSISVEGALKALGTAEAPIQFRANGSGWHSFEFATSDTSTNVLQYTLVEGAGIQNHTAALSIKNSTIVSSDGVALVVYSWNPTNVESSIFWSETAPLDSAIQSDSYNFGVSFSNIQGGIDYSYDEGGNFDLDPRFVDPANGDYRLLPSSPCINAGRWDSRDPDGSRGDIGAFPFYGLAGVLEEDTRWSIGDSPIIVTGIIVPVGVTLTVDPGVEVQFTSHSYLGVFGEISAIGTESQRIQFISTDPDADMMWEDYIAAIRNGSNTNGSYVPSWEGISILTPNRAFTDTVNGEEDAKRAQSPIVSGDFAYVSIRHGSDYWIGDGFLEYGKPATRSKSHVTKGQSSQFMRGKPTQDEESEIFDYNIFGYTRYGGGIDVIGSDAQLMMTHSEIMYNQGNYGGGICAEYGATVTLSSTDIVSNTASSDGGGIQIYNDATTTLTNCTVSLNVVGNNGGGIAGYDSDDFTTLNLYNTTVSDNIARGSGGGIWVTEYATIDGSTISGNIADWRGGGIFSEEATLELTRSHVVGNITTDELGKGGGLAITSDKTNISYVVISQNEAANGAGVYYSTSGEFGTPALRNCTIVNNVGTGLCVGSGVVEVVNSIIWSNSDGQFYTYSGIYYSDVRVSYSNVEYLLEYQQKIDIQYGNIDRNPRFVDAANGDYSLLPYSFCINAGDPNSPNDPDGSRADMGGIPFYGTAGNISTPVTWTKDNSPYYVTGVITVLPYGELTIEPGVDVQFTQNTSIHVQGSLTAIGTNVEGDTIRFRSADPNADAFIEYVIEMKRIELENWNGRVGRTQQTFDIDDLPALWYGIQIMDGGTATIQYADISNSTFDGLEGYLADSFGKTARSIRTPDGANNVVRATKTAQYEYDTAGSGIKVSGDLSTLTLANSVVRHNFGEYGGVAVLDGNTSFTDITVENNFAPWGGGGISILAGQSSLLRCDIRDNVTSSYYYGGGGVYIGEDAQVSFSDCTIERNLSDYYGGGLYNIGTATLIDCRILNNTSFYKGGGIFNNGYAKLTRCDVSSNAAREAGGAIHNYGALLEIIECTITENTVDSYYSDHSIIWSSTDTATTPIIRKSIIARNNAFYGNVVYIDNGLAENPAIIDGCTFVDNDGTYTLLATGNVVVTNTIFWNESASDFYHIGSSGDLVVSYSLVQNGYDGENIIDSNPVFVNRAENDYRLGPNSPCIDAGDPASERDPDGSRADIGALYYHKAVNLALPTVVARSRDEIAVEVRLTAWSVFSAHLAISFSDMSVFDGDLSVTSTAFPETGSALNLDYNVDNDTLLISVLSATPVDFADDVLCVISGKLVGPLAPQEISLAWLTERVEINDEALAHMSNGSLNIVPRYGDVTDDGTVSALDVSEILKYSVRKPTQTDFVTQFAAADVSDNGKITAWDGALILFRVVNPQYRFPVEGGGSPINWMPASKPANGKLANMSSQNSLMWKQVGSSWALTVVNAAGPMGADLVLRLPETAEISSDAAFAYSRENDIVSISVASMGLDNGAELFRVTGVSNTPLVESAILNDQQTTVAMPLQFALHQNMPNPFNPTTTITFSIPEAGDVALAIFDINGRLVRTLVNEQLSANTYGIVWNGTDDSGRAVASGVYIYRLTNGSSVSARRLTLVR